MAIFDKAYVRIIIVVLFFLFAIGANFSMKLPDGKVKISGSDRARFLSSDVKDDWKSAKNDLIDGAHIQIINDEELDERIFDLVAASHVPFQKIAAYLLIALVYMIPIGLGAILLGVGGGVGIAIASMAAIAFVNSFASEAFSQYSELMGSYQTSVMIMIILNGIVAGVLAWLRTKNISSKLDVLQVDYTKIKDRYHMVTTSQEQVQKQVSKLNDKVNIQSQSLIHLYNISRELGSSLDLKSAMTGILSGVAKLVDATSVEMLLLEKGFEVLRVADSIGHEGDAQKLNQVQIKRGEGMIGTAAEQMKLLSKADIKKDFSMGNLSQHPLLPSEIVAPLVLGDELIGVINVSNVNKQCGQEEVRLLHVVSSLAAMAMKNAKLFTKIKELAEVDGLTKMFNNRFFKEYMDEEIIRSQQYGDQFSLLLSDIDHFKGFNDTFGHQVGDLVLAETAAVFKNCCRQDIDIAARYGGEEFCLVLPKMGVEEARIAAEHVRQSVADQLFELTPELAESDKVQQAIKNPPGPAPDGKPILQMGPNGLPLLHVTVSIGVATYPLHATNRDFMVKKSDEALYVAKESGRNQVQIAK